MLTIGFLLLVIIGYFILDLLAFDLVWEEKISLSYGVGFGFVSLLIFLLLYFKLLDSGIKLIILMILALIILFAGKLVVRKRGIVNLNNLRKDIFSNRQNYKLYLVVLPLFVFSLWFSFYYPVIITDGNDYEVTGRLIALNGNIEQENFFRPYPPLIPVAYSFVYFLGGTHSKIIFPFFYLSLVLCFYFRLIALKINKKLSLIFTLILVTTPYVWWHSFLGILNLTAAYYFSVATLFWFSHLKNISKSGNGEKINYSHPLLAGVFYGLSIFTRFEMLAYFLIPLVLTALYSLKYHITKNVLYLSLPPLCIASYWSFFSSYIGVPGGSFSLVPIALVFLIVVVIMACCVLFTRGCYQLIALIEKCEVRLFFLPNMLGVSFILLLTAYFFVPHDIQHSVHFVNQSVFFIKTVITKIVTCLVGNGFFLFTSVLMGLLLPKMFIKNGHGEREHAYLFIFILLFMIINSTIFSLLFFSSYPEGYTVVCWNYDLRELLKAIVYHPGQIINNTQIRGLLPIYPIIIFFFAISKKVQDAFEV